MLQAIGALAVTDSNFIVGNGSTWVAESGATARASMGVSIGSQVQAYDAGLQSIAGLATAADRMIYTTALDVYAVATLTAFARTLLDDASASAARSTLGLGAIALESSPLGFGAGGTGETTRAAALAALGAFGGYCDASAAAENVPSGWSITNPSTGNYTVTHNLGLSLTTDLGIGVALFNGTYLRVWVTSLGTNSFGVRVQQTGGSNVNDEWLFSAVLH